MHGKYLTSLYASLAAGTKLNISDNLAAHENYIECYRLATDSEKQKMIKALKKSENPESPKQAITGFKFQNETDNIRPFLSIRIRGKDEIIPFKDKKEIQSVKAHLCSIFSGFVKIGDWYLKMSEVKEYKPVTAEDMNPYILFKTSKFGNIKVRFPKDEDMNAELLVLDQLFDVE